MFALAKRGAGAKPLQKERCHPEERPQAAWRRRISCRPIYKGGAVPVRSVLM